MAGQQLRSLREQRRLSVRDVEEASRRIAEAKRDERYRISNGWLVHLEKSDSLPNPHHLFTLCATYRVSIIEILHLYGIDIDDLPECEALANPQLTQLLSLTGSSVDFGAPSTTRFAPELAAQPPLKLALQRSHSDSNIRYVQLGEDELTMYPLIRPGSIVVIDTTQQKVETDVCKNDFERPIYCVEMRHRVSCGWCVRRNNKLLIVAYRSSSFQEVLPQDAVILGRVVAYYTPCVDAGLGQPAKQRATTG